MFEFNLAHSIQFRQEQILFRAETILSPNLISKKKYQIKCMENSVFTVVKAAKVQSNGRLALCHTQRVISEVRGERDIFLYRNVSADEVSTVSPLADGPCAGPIIKFSMVTFITVFILYPPSNLFTSNLLFVYFLIVFRIERGSDYAPFLEV